MAIRTPDTTMTCTDMMEKLREKKMNNEWVWSRYGLTVGKGKLYAADQLTIIYSQHFDECSEPIGANHIYVIQAEDGMTGFCLDAAGSYTEAEDRAGFEEFIGQIREADPEDRLVFSVEKDDQAGR